MNLEGKLLGNRYEIIEKIANNCDYEIIFRNKITKEEISTKNIERKL